MNTLTNIIENKSLVTLTNGASQDVIHAIGQASEDTGVDFAYLVQQAKAESNFDPSAKASTSSATGLYQFIERTWLGMVRDHGEKYGLGEYAQHIDSKARVSDRAMRKEILALRNDPEIASQMAAEFALENKEHLDKTWGGDIGATELYLAHFLGAGGAASFLNARDETPNAPAADLFPRPAIANRNVFYDRKTGEARTVEEVYAFFDKKFQIEGIETPAPVIDDNPQIASKAQTGKNLAHSLFSDSGSRVAQSSGFGGLKLYSFDEFAALSGQDKTEKSAQEAGRDAERVNFYRKNVVLDHHKSSAGHYKGQIPQGFFTLVSNPADLMILSQTNGVVGGDKS